MQEKYLMNIHYIHGKADIANILDSNNLILGIFEDDKKNKRVEFCLSGNFINALSTLQKYVNIKIAWSGIRKEIKEYL